LEKKMKLESLILENYRCFERLELPLHPKMTVLVAENGQGKSTLLDGIRVGLCAYVHSFDLANNADLANGIVDTGEVAGVDFHAVTGLDAVVIAEVQTWVRRRVLRTFVRRGLIDKRDADVMGAWIGVRVRYSARRRDLSNTLRATGD
jgi:hypothetical protein